MTTQQPDAQPDYLDELLQISSGLTAAHMRLSALMNDIGDGPDGRLPGEWNECYRAVQALHLATQLAGDAIDRERERRAPVPYLPAEYMEQAAALIAAAIEDGTPLTVEDGS